MGKKRDGESLLLIVLTAHISICTFFPPYRAKFGMFAPMNSQKVPLLDLVPQYRGLKPELDAVLLRIAESQYFILGPEVEGMERAMAGYLETEHALGVSSGTDALLLALMALGVGPGDEVIVPTFSFFATAGVVSRLNARPVLVDVDPRTYNIDPQKVAEAITEKTAAIVPVHLFGQSADMDALMALAAKHGVPVVEDAAQAIGTRYRDGRRVGSIGSVGCFSFFPSKNLGAFGDAGLVTTNDPELFERLRIMRVHGGERQYYHAVIGGNFRIDALQAAVLSVKLPHLDAWSEGRRSNAARYRELFIDAGLSASAEQWEPQEEHPVGLPQAIYEDSGAEKTHIYNQYVVRVPRRDELRTHLAEKGVGSAVYYPVPFHRQECFADLGYAPDAFPVAERAAEQVLALPVYPELSDEQLQYVVAMIAEFYKG